MDIKLERIPIRKIISKYEDNALEGVTGYEGKLDIRPAYQREFIYKDKQRNAVIETINKGFPLNVMYWVKAGDDHFEILDGQQRTISFCQYCNGDFSLDGNYYHSLTAVRQKLILDYELMIYICEGNEQEKLDWFKIINIAGEKLYDQELRNVVYTGQWLSDAKKHFSRHGCAAYGLGKDYMQGTPIRQDYLETALKWISNGEIEDYMSKHHHHPNAKELWEYFQNVIDWVDSIFRTRRPSIMSGLPYGDYYNKYKNCTYDPIEIEKQVNDLLEDEDVTSKSGVFKYIITGDEKHLSIRAFLKREKVEAYNRQDGICVKCKKKFKMEEMQADHITPFSERGRTTSDNCQMLCKRCNRTKSNK